MIIKTGRAGMVWVDWPPVEDGEVWCRGPSAEEGRPTTVYRLVDGQWLAGDWDVEGRESLVRDALH